MNESAADRSRNLDLFAGGRETDWRNRLIWGDKKYVLPSLLPEFAGKVNLIYIDPPFDTGADFSFTATIPDHPDTEEDETTSFVKQPSIIEQKAYRDTWGRGLDSYLQWFYETAVLLRDLLAEDGSIYVHLDYHVGHYAKAVMDEIFSSPNFRNEIVWKRSTNTGSSKVLARGFSNDHDTILLFSKSESFVANKQFVPHSEAYIKSKFTQKDARGLYQLQPLKTVSKEKLARLRKEGMVVEQEGQYLRYKQYLNDSKGKPVNDIWTDVFAVNSQASERMDYITQKPEALLERIIKASSNEGDLVLDCFCGSGTTAAVAEKLNRKWITCDLGRFAIHTTRKRLLAIPHVKPFVVQNLGKYERQVWQAAEFPSQNQAEDQREREVRYRKFILELYHADPVSGYTWLHGLKSGRMVHVGAVDAPVTLSDVKAMAAEIWRAVGKGKDSPQEAGIDVLGWEFAFELNELARQIAAEARVDIRFKKIPREVLEKRAVEQGDIHFFELAALTVDLKTKRKGVQPNAPTVATLKLKDFIPPHDDVPQEVIKAITHWSQWIDYWAVDWNYQGDTFHNEWQTFR
ncbi:site-specific DNA-methyltransferase, partial [candidate division KSB1 bacterium]|nr:site-specific DNA-methyltransferase [candidate division KSB1 bacterium]